MFDVCGKVLLEDRLVARIPSPVDEIPDGRDILVSVHWIRRYNTCRPKQRSFHGVRETDE